MSQGTTRISRHSHRFRDQLHDGNPKTDDGFTYTWDAENRLSRVQSGDPNSPADGDTKVEFVYDYLGRRVEKKVSEHNGTSWSVSDCRRFVYSDWLPVLELEGGVGVPPANTILRKYTWGLDLAGQNQSPERERGVTIDSAAGIGRVAHPLRSKGRGRDSPRLGHQKPLNPARIPQPPLQFTFTALRPLPSTYNP